MATKLQHGDSLYQVIEKVNEIIDGTVQPGSGGSGESGGGSAAINGVQDMVYAEIDRAQAAEQYLQEQINAITTPESGNNSGATPDINSIQPALIIESLRAAIAEQYNAASLSDEVARAQAAEQTLQTNINNEVTRATTAEQNLQDQIDAIDVSGLQQDIDDEVTRAQVAEQNLQDQIDAITPVKETYSATLNGEKGSTWIINATRYNGIITIGIGYQLGSGQTTAAGETVSSTDVLPAKWRPCMSIYELTAMFANQTQYIFRLLINTNGQLQFTNGSSGTAGSWSRIWCYLTYIAGDLT